MKSAFYISVTFTALVWCTLINGLVAAKLWSWFIVPTFGLPKLSMPAAIGLWLLARSITYRSSTKTDDEPYLLTLFKGAAVLTLDALIVLLIGGIVRTWL
jgi:hypothetical protein